MIRAFFKLIRILIYCAAALILLVAVAGLVVMKWPHLLINERTLLRAADYASQKGIVDVRWSSAFIDVQSPAFLKKELAFDFRDLCVKLPEDELRACFSDVSFAFSVSFSKLRPRIVEAGPVRIRGGDVSASLNEREEGARPPAKRSVSTGKSASRSWLPSWLQKTVFGPISIELDRVSIRDRTKTYLASARIKGQGVERGFELTGEANGKIVLDSKKQNPSSARASFDLRTQDFRSLSAVHYKVRGDFNEGRKKIEVAAEGDATRDRVAGNAEVTLHRIAREVPWIQATNCAFSSARQNGPANRGLEATFSHGARVSVDCPVHLRIPVPPQRYADFKVPSRVGVRLQADLETAKFPVAIDDLAAGHVSVAIEPILRPLFQGSGTIQSTVEGIPAEFPKRWKADTDLALDLVLPKFKRVAEVLRKAHTEWAVPAPFHALDGRVEIEVAGKFDLEKGEFPVEVRTRLGSENQRLDMDAGGMVRLASLTPAPVLDAEMNLTLSDVRLQLPRLDLAKPPRLFPDSRIKPFHEVKKARAEGAARLDYTLAVHTAEAPVQVISNLAKAPIPVRMRIQLAQDQPPLGTVMVEKFPLELFRRDARMNFFNIELAHPSPESVIHGEAQVKYADYTIKMTLLGTTGHPRIKLTSDPPLPEEQLVAVLLFGRPLDELDPDQSQSVGNAQAAFAAGAIGLASLYILASTPIQSVTYDPSTGLLSAKVRLAEGTSLNVGTGSGSLKELGIRKRLGPHWTITTDLNPSSTTTGNRTVTAFLEWTNRY